jgi:hypothetical protein
MTDDRFKLIDATFLDYRNEFTARTLARALRGQYRLQDVKIPVGHLKWCLQTYLGLIRSNEQDLKLVDINDVLQCMLMTPEPIPTVNYDFCAQIFELLVKHHEKFQIKPAGFQMENFDNSEAI